MNVEIQTERDEAIALFPHSYSGQVLRIRCRRQGERRWQKFLLVPDEGEGWDELEAKAQLAAETYMAESA